MTSRWPLGMILMSTLVISCTMPLRAGTFRLFDLSYEVWTLPNNYREIRVLVGARAIYKGKVDREDMDANWVINTHLNTTMYWKVPDVAQLQTLLPVGT